MYGTLFRCRPRPGQEHGVEELTRRWLRERAPEVAGFTAAYLLRSETRPGELLGLVVFDSRADYAKNAADPEQHRWYEQLRALLAGDIEWNDGEIVLLEAARTPL
jgi:quinol monooxygenase YgiN